LKDPSGLFNSSLDGNVRRAIDIHEGDKVDEAALKDLIRAAVALNLVKNPRKMAVYQARPARASRNTDGRAGSGSAKADFRSERV
jgi:ribosomal protein L19E